MLSYESNIVNILPLFVLTEEANKAAKYGSEDKVLPQKPGAIPEDASDPFPPLEDDDDYDGEQVGFDAEEETYTPSPRLIPPSNIPATGRRLSTWSIVFRF
jgi:hypothetical protein